MIVLMWAQWWYGAGWKQCATRVADWLKAVEASFSLGILLKTLFSPWKQVITGSAGSIGDRFRAFIDNLVSRFVGFGIRIITLIAAGITLAVGVLGGALLVVAWPLIPIAVPVLIIWGLL